MTSYAFTTQIQYQSSTQKLSATSVGATKHTLRYSKAKVATNRLTKTQVTLMKQFLDYVILANQYEFEWKLTTAGERMYCNCRNYRALNQERTTELLNSGAKLYVWECWTAIPINHFQSHYSNLAPTYRRMEEIWVCITVFHKSCLYQQTILQCFWKIFYKWAFVLRSRCVSATNPGHLLLHFRKDTSRYLKVNRQLRSIPAPQLMNPTCPRDTAAIWRYRKVFSPTVIKYLGSSSPTVNSVGYCSSLLCSKQLFSVSRLSTSSFPKRLSPRYLSRLELYY